MRLSAIYLDMDGVLVDFVGGVLREFGCDPKGAKNVRSWDGIPAEISRQLGRTVSDGEMWGKNEGAAFWAGLEWLPLGRELLSVCESSGLPVVFMSTPCADPYSAAGKLIWLAKHVPDGARRYALSPCKHHMAHRGAILIDDGPHNVDRFQAHDGLAFLWPATWNEYGCSPSRSALERVGQILRMRS